MPGGIASKLERRSNAPERTLQARQSNASSSQSRSSSTASTGPTSSSQSTSSRGSSTASTSPTSSSQSRSSGGSSTTLTNSLSSPPPPASTTTSPSRTYSNLFPPSSTSSPTPPHRTTLPQTVLMWILAVIAVGVIGILVIWRWSCVRARRESRGRPGTGTRLDSPPPSLSDRHFRNTWDRDTRAITLSPTFLHTGLTMPLVDSQGRMIPPRDRRRVQALDVDAGGRRGGRPAGEDGEPDDGAYDELPAYDGDKAPPGYHPMASSSGPPPASPF